MTKASNGFLLVQIPSRRLESSDDLHLLVPEQQPKRGQPLLTIIRHKRGDSEIEMITV